MNKPAYIHPSAEVSPRSKIGLGSKVWHQAQIMEDVEVGNNCIIGKGVFVSGPTRIGNKVKLQNYVNIFGAMIEDEVLIGPMTAIVHDNNPRSTTPSGRLKSRFEYSTRHSILKRGCSIGAGSVIMPGVVIGKFALVAAGSVVHRDVADNALVMGNPARQLGYVCICGYRLDDGLTCRRCRLKYQACQSGISRTQ